ncbi:hypothetical protein [Sandaracinus amylolyticus]|uniref:hypothetical protein n=1 Tax=Sandaracinus amylolyticus TaxID=927083 RepID=UPI001F47D3D4|nr:hypothetical protein [Sandaracinus amylolyticus]UJR84304.1 Hypothetical protein I5071_63820 [Sandaracinus amylolyticus]
MTQVLQIPTPFADLSELTENFAQRVDEERLMLPHVEPMPEGEWVQFTVLLGDGNVAIAGVGRVQGSFDNGEEHPPEYRFDVVLDSLQFEGMHEVMFERLLMARASLAGGEPVTGEVSVEELERAAAVQPAAEASEPEAAWQDDAQDWPAQAAAEEPVEPEPPQDSGTGEVDVGELAEVASYGDHAAEPTPPPARAAAPSQRPAPPSQRPAAIKRPPAQPYPTRAREPGKLPSPHSFEGRALTRPSLDAVWTPTPAERPDAAQSSGYFDYQGGVPRPAHPPRPELDASLRVIPAPRPGAPWPRAQAAVAAAAAAVAMSVGEPADSGFEEEEVSAQVELPDGDGEREEW